jgi:hypothetical protein
MPPLTPRLKIISGMAPLHPPSVPGVSYSHPCSSVPPLPCAFFRRSPSHPQPSATSNLVWWVVSGSSRQSWESGHCWRIRSPRWWAFFLTGPPDLVFVKSPSSFGISITPLFCFCTLFFFLVFFSQSLTHPHTRFFVSFFWRGSCSVVFGRRHGRGIRCICADCAGARHG